MKNDFKALEREARAKAEERKCKRDENGRAVICMNIKDDSGFLSEFSMSETPVISEGVAEFIESKTRDISPGEKLKLHIHSDCIDDREKEIYTDAIKEYYLQKYIANEEQIKRNRLLVLILGLLGVLVLIAEIIFTCNFDNAIWAEVIDIVAWVLLWEATDIALLASGDLRIKKKRCLSYFSMEIEYSTDTEYDKEEESN